MKESHKNRPPQSDETKLKRSKSMTGKAKSFEHREALSRALKAECPGIRGQARLANK